MKHLITIGLLLLSIALPTLAKQYPFPRPAFDIIVPDDWLTKFETEPMTFTAPDEGAQIFIKAFEANRETARDLFFPQWQQEFFTLTHQGVTYAKINALDCLQEQGEGLHKSGKTMTFLLTFFKVSENSPTYLIGALIEANRQKQYQPIIQQVLATLQVDVREQEFRLATVNQIALLARMIGLYQIDKNRLPTALTDLLPSYYNASLNDAWGTAIYYAPAGTGYTLKSLGKDQVEGGSGVNTDIVYINGQFISGHQRVP